VIPTFRNEASLARCLRGLLADSSIVSRELIVVDNAGSEPTEQVVAAAAGDPPFPVRLVREPRAGSSFARNAGAREARGAYLFFVDDDIVVSDTWADALAQGFADERVGLVAGRVLPRWPYEPPAWLRGPAGVRLTLTDFGAANRLLRSDERPETANVGVRVAAIPNREHPFETTLGNRGRRQIGSADYRFVDEIRRTHLLAYAADAVGYHCIEPHRMTMDWLRPTYFDMGIGLYRAELMDGYFPPPILRRIVRTTRLCRSAHSHRRRNERVERSGPETVEELLTYQWAGRHAEMLLGRIPPLRDLVRRVVV